MIWLSLWSYFIDNYDDTNNIGNIHWSLALSVLFPAFLTFLVHNFFAQRIFMLSKRNYILTTPIVVLAILRLVSASVTTSYMLKLRTFQAFKENVKFIFTTGLALSTTVDVIITASLFVLLQSSRTGAATLDAVIDALIRYTFETSTLTSAGTIASMLCWLIIPHNLIFMGLHFVIGKLYANSLLVTLNTRESIRRARSEDHGLRVDIMKEPRKPHKSHDSGDITLQSSQVESKLKEDRFMKVEVVVERSVQMEQP
jgi:low affinity Fe/Cu permease